MQTNLLSTSPPGTAEAIRSLQLACPSLPAEYLSFLARFNGAEGSLGIEPGWFLLWPAEEVANLSAGYQVPQYLPGYVAFGSNGGGELFVFPLQPTDGALPVFMAPAIGMGPSALIKVAASFSEFAAAFGKDLA
jgi:hypothetical protein